MLGLEYLFGLGLVVPFTKLRNREEEFIFKPLGNKAEAEIF